MGDTPPPKHDDVGEDKEEEDEAHADVEEEEIMRRSRRGMRMGNCENSTICVFSTDNLPDRISQCGLPHRIQLYFCMKYKLI